MIYKRIIFLLENTISSISNVLEGIKQCNIDNIIKEEKDLPTMFNNLDWVNSQFEDIKKESNFKFKIMNYRRRKIENLQNNMSILRLITHLNYDLIQIITSEKFEFSEIYDRKKVIKSLEATIDNFKALKEGIQSKHNTRNTLIVINNVKTPFIITKYNEDSYYCRFIDDINEIGIQTNRIIEETKKIKF